jgi:hypothetical protein
MQNYTIFVAGGVISLSATSAMQAEANATSLGYIVVGVVQQSNS